MRIPFALLLAMTACGSDTASTGPDAPPPPPPDGFQHLIANAWTLPPGTQKYLCVRQTATADIYLSTIRPISPVGTHHSVLMIGAPDGPDGTVECDSSLTKPAIYASGVGTQELALPTGVAVHIKPGQQLLLNLHLFNGADSTLDGTSGIDYLPIEAASVVHEAGVVLAGATNFTIPTGGATTITGTCTTPAGVTAFAVAPHMHLLGTHMKISYTDPTTSATRVLFDDGYSFDAQQFHLFTPELATVNKGKLTVDCTYMNTTGKTVTFGEHTEDEMCYALSFVYPPPITDSCTK